MNKLLVFGSLNYDNIYTVSHITGPGETQSSQELNIRLGGKGYNQAVAAKCAGVEVWLAGQVGEDGQPFLNECQRRGIHTEFLRKVPGCKTGHAVIQVDQSAQNSILLYGGANQMLEKAYIDRVLGSFGKGDYLLLQNEVNDLDYIIEQAYANGMKIILNPSPFDEKISCCNLEKVSWLFVNEIEGKQIAGNTGGTLIDVLHDKITGCNIILTLGGRGADCIVNGVKLRQEAFRVIPVDTTGAGDCFTGYFMGRMINCCSGENALRFAAAAAALCITRPGAAEAIPDYEEVLHFLKIESEE